MSPVRSSAPGATRVCPHCRSTILESATVCPACKHHLRSGASTDRGPTGSVALKVDGMIEHPDVGEPWEYSVLLTIRNGRGEEVTRHVAGVGVMHPSDKRSFTLSVEVYAPGKAPFPGTRTG